MVDGGDGVVFPVSLRQPIDARWLSCRAKSVLWKVSFCFVMSLGSCGQLAKHARTFDGGLATTAGVILLASV